MMHLKKRVYLSICLMALCGAAIASESPDLSALVPAAHKSDDAIESLQGLQESELERVKKGWEGGDIVESYMVDKGRIMAKRMHNGHIRCTRVVPIHERDGELSITRYEVLPLVNQKRCFEQLQQAYAKKNEKKGQKSNEQG